MCEVIGKIRRRIKRSQCYDPDMADHVTCDICGITIERHEHFVVRIDIFADPSTPPIDTDHWNGENVTESIEGVIEKLSALSADDLQDDVHRRFEYRLCAACQKRFLSNPLGLPRRRASGKN